MNHNLLLTSDQTTRLHTALGILLTSAADVDMGTIITYYVDAITPAHAPVTEQDERDYQIASSWSHLQYALTELGKLQTELGGVLAAADSEVQS